MCLTSYWNIQRVQRAANRQSRRRASLTSAKSKKPTWSQTMSKMVKSRFFTNDSSKKKKNHSEASSDVTDHVVTPSATIDQRPLELDLQQKQPTARRLPSVETEVSVGSNHTCEEVFGQSFVSYSYS